MENVLNVKIINIQETTANMNVKIVQKVNVISIMGNVQTKKMTVLTNLIMEMTVKLLVVILFLYAKNVKGMEHVLNVKMNYILVMIALILAINVQMKNVILVENVMIKNQIVKMMNIMEKNAIFNVIQLLKSNIA